MFGPGLDRRQWSWFCFGMRRADNAEFGGSKGECNSAEKAAAVMVDGLVHIDLVHS
jgi:hypothetical protein